MLTSTTSGLTALVFFGDLVAFFAGLAAGFFAAAGFLAFGFAASKIQRNGW
jgi:hypothetical protein